MRRRQRAPPRPWQAWRVPAGLHPAVPLSDCVRVRTLFRFEFLKRSCGVVRPGPPGPETVQPTRQPRVRVDTGSCFARNGSGGPPANANGADGQNTSRPWQRFTSAGNASTCARRPRPSLRVTRIPSCFSRPSKFRIIGLLGMPGRPSSDVLAKIGFSKIASSSGTANCECVRSSIWRFSSSRTGL